MFLYLLCLYANNYVVFYDKEEKLLGCEKAFNSIQQRVIYHVLLHYMHEFEKKDFLDVLHEMHTRCRSSDYTQEQKLCSSDVKKILVGDILTRYKLGAYDPVMLDFASDFDERLVQSLEYICIFDYEIVKSSAATQIADHTEQHFRINRCLGLLALVYVTLFSEVIWHQKENKQWIYSKECELMVAVRKYIAELDEVSEQFFQNNHKYIPHEYSFNHILRGRVSPNYLKAKVHEYQHKLHNVFAIYSQWDIFNAFKSDFNLTDRMILCPQQIRNVLDLNERLCRINSFFEILYRWKLYECFI